MNLCDGIRGRLLIRPENIFQSRSSSSPLRECLCAHVPSTRTSASRQGGFVFSFIAIVREEEVNWVGIILPLLGWHCTDWP